MESEIYENYKYIKGEIILSAKLKTKYQEVHDLVTSYGGEIVGYLKTANEYQILFYDDKTEKELIEIINKLNSNNKVLYSNLNLAADISVIRQPSLNYTEEPWLWAITVEKPLP